MEIGKKYINKLLTVTTLWLGEERLYQRLCSDGTPISLKRLNTAVTLLSASIIMARVM